MPKLSYSQITQFIENMYSLNVRDFNDSARFNDNHFKQWRQKNGYGQEKNDYKEPGALEYNQKLISDYRQDPNGLCKEIERLDFWAWLIQDKGYMQHVKRKGVSSYVDIKIQTKKWLEDAQTPDYVKIILRHLKTHYGDVIDCRNTW